MERIYICIDLKSFYASVECRERNLNPMTTNLVVADSSRTEKTICLAVSPSLKQYGIGGRARLFEVVAKIKEVNRKRKFDNKIYKFIGKSYNDDELKNNPNLEIDYIVAPPRMNLYMKYSTNIYNVYLKYLSPDDIYVYSIDEVFCDITAYLKFYKTTPREFVTKLIKDVYLTTGITATAGIGTNMYLAKIAMDIVAKKAKANEFGVRIAELDEVSYRKLLWNHKPLTSFWRVGNGYAKKLEENKMFTMGDVARCSIENEDLLYKLFGVNAELLIDHAWGYEPCTIKDVKSYKPTTNSISSGQVLHCSYNYNQTKLIIKEMTDLLSLDLVNKKLITDQLVLTIGYDIDNEITEYEIDRYGRKIPKHSHGTINIDHKTSSSKILTEHMIKLYDKIVNKNLLIRRINMSACNVVDESLKKESHIIKQFNLFDDNINVDIQTSKDLIKEDEEKKLQEVLLNIKNKYGKNSILKGINYLDDGTTRERNEQVGGHKG